MRYITVPPDVVVEQVTKPDGTSPTISFKELVLGLVTDPKVTHTDGSIGLFIDVSDLVKGAATGDVLELTDEQHEFLSGLSRGFGYGAEVKLAILPMLKAITGAAKQRP